MDLLDVRTRAWQPSLLSSYRSTLSGLGKNCAGSVMSSCGHANMALLVMRQDNKQLSQLALLQETPSWMLETPLAPLLAFTVASSMLSTASFA